MRTTRTAWKPGTGCRAGCRSANIAERSPLEDSDDEQLLARARSPGASVVRGRGTCGRTATRHARVAAVVPRTDAPLHGWARPLLVACDDAIARGTSVLRPGRSAALLFHPGRRGALVPRSAEAGFDVRHVLLRRSVGVGSLPQRAHASAQRAARVRGGAASEAARQPCDSARAATHRCAVGALSA